MLLIHLFKGVCSKFNNAKAKKTNYEVKKIFKSFRAFVHMAALFSQSEGVSQSTGSSVGPTRAECLICCPTLRDSSVTTGNYTLHRVKTAEAGGEEDRSIVS